MGKCIDKIPHDACGSNKGLQVFVQDNEEVNGFCFACDTFVKHPYGADKPSDYRPEIQIKSQEDIDQEIAEISQYPTVTLHDRKLNQASLEYFGIKIGLSQSDGETPVSHHYPYKHGSMLRAYKTRLIEGKRMWTTGEMDGVDLFGWEQAVQTGARRLFITEGELDAAALWQMIMRQQKGTKYEDNYPAVVSLTRGSGNAVNDITRNAEKIRRHFDQIVLVFDQDEPGQLAEVEVLKIAPEYMTVKLPEKDANACLIAGKSKVAVQQCLFQAEVPKNTSLVWGSSLHEAGRQQAEWGASYPWAGLTNLTRGIRMGETIYIGAGVKMGKSELVNAIVAHCILEHGWKCFVAKPEEANRKTYQLVVGKAVGGIFHDPKVEFNYDLYDKGSKLIGDNLAMVNLYQHMGWDTLKNDIRSAAAAGCQAILIDPITNLTIGMKASEANEKLQEIAAECASMAHDLGIVIFIFCHLKAPEGGKSHERGGEVLSTQFSGSRAMMRSCNYMIGLEGDKSPDLDPDFQCQRDLVVLEDREFGQVGRVGLRWSPITSLFTER